MKLFVPIVAACLAFAAGCSNDVTTPSVSVQGNWSLRTLNGQTLPAQVSSGLAVTSETLSISSNGSYSDIVYFSDGTYSTEDGYYTLNNNSITFVDQTDNNYSYTGSISGSVLTSFSNGYTSVYQKS